MKRDHTLLEIIFSVIAVIFVGVFAVLMFVKADNMQNGARDMDMASLAAQSAVETFKSQYSHPETVYFDRNFQVVSEIDEKGFVLTMDITDDGMGLFDVNVDVARVKPYFGETGTHILSLSTAVYAPSSSGTVKIK